MNIRVGIVDDHKLISEGVRQLFEYSGGFSVSFELHSGEECIMYLDEHPNCVDVILLDINMPEMNGVEVLKIVKSMKSNVKVIMLTVYNDVEMVKMALENGADGYLLKDVGFSELIQTVQSVYQGEKYVQPDIVKLINMDIIKRDTMNEELNYLTDREIEVLVEIANGKMNKEIADSLGISERTVKNHISNIFKKINVFDRTQAAVFAVKHNLIQSNN